MRLHRFYISEPIGTQKEVSVESAELVNQIRKVFRKRVSDEVVLFDGSGTDYNSTISGFDENLIKFRISSAGRSRYMPPCKLYLCAAVVKKDNFEYIVEKATELGVTDIIPVMAERSEKKSLNDARLKKIAVEASEQSGRGDVPNIHAINDLRAMVEQFKKDKVDMLALHTEGENFDRDEILNDEPLALFVGPEGGWSPNELDMFHKSDVSVQCLGAQVLRAETAVISALSQVVFN